MTYLSENLKLLRKRSQKSQEEVAAQFDIKRARWNSFERGTAPDYDTLIQLSDSFKVSIDHLIRKDLSQLRDQELEELLSQGKTDIKGKHLRVLATTVDSENRDNIELVPIRARAGYTTGYGDPGYISVLQAFTLPFVDRNKKCRTFQISGDSMPPVPEGGWVTGQYVDNWESIRDKFPYVVVTKEEGIVFKIVYNKIKEDQTILLCSTNPSYKPYPVHISEVLEVWKFIHYISPELPEPNLFNNQIVAGINNLQAEIAGIKSALKQ
jgi:transcriptional regulator with XRE-family HTH domain